MLHVLLIAVQGQTPLGRRRTETEPMPSVIMAGGLFAMDRKLFHETGEYDPEMQVRHVRWLENANGRSCTAARRWRSRSGSGSVA